MRVWCSIFTFAAAVFALQIAWASDDGWRLEKDEDGIQVYTRAVEGWSIREIKAIAQFPIRLSSVAAVINDVSATRDLNDMVSEAEIRNRESETRYQIYTVIKMPWPIHDRDILNQREITQDKSTLTVTVSDVAIPDVIPNRNGLVQMVKSRQQWVLTPTPDGRVMVELRMLSDPAGPIPASVINAMAVSAPFKTLRKLRGLAQRPIYAHARLSFIKEDEGS